MAAFINFIANAKKSKIRFILEIIVYALMVVLILIFFSGNGEFIYEAF